MVPIQSGMSTYEELLKKISVLAGSGPIETTASYGNFYEDALTNIIKREQDEKIKLLQQQLSESTAKLYETIDKADLSKKEIEKEAEQLQVQNAELRREQELRHLLDRVTPKAAKVLMESQNLQASFSSNELLPAYVVSIDIRRSTELMLKARKPDDFAQFISDLCASLRKQIIDNYGVFDKFTGDGILAFFPKFFSGGDAGYRALRAVDACHKIFAEHYRNNRSRFSSVLLDIGLGIGVDFGDVKFVRIGNEITVVGTPVVYACRLGGAPAGCTYLNQPARDEIFDKYISHCTITETSLPFKHEGAMLAYKVELNGNDKKSMVEPAWIPKADGKAKAAAESPEAKN